MKLLSSVTILVLCLMLLSCGTWQTNAVKGYKAGAGVLTETHNSVTKMCNEGTMSESKCSTFKEYYKIAYSAYIKLGDAIKMAIKASDEYDKAMYQLEEEK